MPKTKYYYSVDGTLSEEEWKNMLETIDPTGCLVRRASEAIEYLSDKCGQQKKYQFLIDVLSDVSN
jgi:hypothetical protein